VHRLITGGAQVVHAGQAADLDRQGNGRRQIIHTEALSTAVLSSH
jgi:hypothetical protein